MKNHLRLYLENHAEKASVDVASHFPPVRDYQHCLVIPTYNETDDFIHSILQSTLGRESLLIIVVINQPQTDSDTRINAQLWNQLQQQGDVFFINKYHYLVNSETPSLQLLVCDYFSGNRKLAHKHGVGRARKLGSDIACGLRQQQRIKSHWLHTTDADTQLPGDYFAHLPDHNIHSALVYPYRHVGTDAAITKATQRYEQALNYYVDGLKYAGSAYAFHTLGSCIAVNIEDYAKVRGFPKRAGGEDFYLLNKLAKVGAIAEANTCPLRIQARLSQRADFGTGPAVDKILSLMAQNREYTYYNPQVFVALRTLLQHMASWYQYRDNHLLWLQQLSPPLQNALTTINIQELMGHLSSQAFSPAQFNKHIHDWFDGFKTLKFIHSLEHDYPKIGLEQALVEFDSIKNTN